MSQSGPPAGKRPVTTSYPPRRVRASGTLRVMPARLLNVEAEEASAPPEPPQRPADRAITDPEVDRYLTELHQTGDQVLQEMEHFAQAAGLSVVGPVVGSLLRQIAQSIAARDIFEMGSGIGYATLFLARGVSEGGRVVHTDRDPVQSQRARGFLGQAGVLERVSFEVGDAVTILADYPGPFDLIFIDVDKAQYPEALELARPRVRVGGYIITDNVLWRGRVIAEGPWDAETLGVLRYTRAALAAPDLYTTFLPLRDGVALHLKLSDARRRR